MTTTTTLAVSCVLSATLAGCCCPHVHDSAAAPSVEIPTARETPTECVATGGIGPAGLIAAGTYCVCNTGDHKTHGDDPEQVTAQHLANGAAVVIRSPDKVTDVDLGLDKLPMNLSSDGRELLGLMNYPHSKTVGGSQNILHQVRITRLDAIDPDDTPGCVEGKTTLRIQFCFRRASDGRWECARSSGDYGDTHVQN
jgi:hypothetical protein